ncbi:nicotinamide riboside transporter PnuC [Rhodococcus hoagii]|uniref:Nicotinamide mononucleotide transporter n=2 Tax=Rhodococcus hoagii TaxID=43767 RepID=A0A3S5Y5J0_RHOH1|nr:nicotinamide riboside transporter PnuC [Prescottella equi]CBH47741.1 putative nicotinamide mononucleotide transporter [Prescottella equi 103S]NKR85934.1 nicotinamide riboside transporter PnuC [Prescottella equi]NKS05920.1 nicotinamide riboside transporter PnuC [Prescottella equi]NKS94759.1 nicotinamide riboside transporter PnuC [Prescottella equi]
MMIDFLNSTAFTAFGAPTSWAEVLGFVTGAWCVWLVGRQSVWNWPIGIANNLVWILLFATAGLFADSALQVVYIALAVWGWHNWVQGRNGDTLAVTGTSGTEWVWLAGVGIAGTGALTVLLDTATSSTVPFWDAVTTVLSLLATWGQATKRWESWLLWIAADLIYIPLYLHKGLTLTALLYCGFLLLCVRGLLAWRRSRATEPVMAVAQ